MITTFLNFPEKKDANKCEEYRSISLISQVLKLFFSILHKRIVKCDDGVGTREPLFALQDLVQKCKDMQQEVYFCFIDYEKAFDRVQHDRLITLLLEISLDDTDIRIIQNTGSVWVGGEESREVEAKMDIRLGCILSPSQFNIYSEAIMAEA